MFSQTLIDKVTSRKGPSLQQILEWEKPKFELGNDLLPYAVFRCNDYSWEYSDLVFGKDPFASNGGGIACFGGYENAVCLQDTIGL